MKYTDKSPLKIAVKCENTEKNSTIRTAYGQRCQKHILQKWYFNFVVDFGENFDKSFLAPGWQLVVLDGRVDYVQFVEGFGYFHLDLEHLFD